MSAPRRVIFAPSAVRDLDDMVDWYVQQQVRDVGRPLLEEIIHRTENLLRHQDMARMVPEFGVANLRELIHPPFRIVYRRKSAEIHVLRVRRTERELKIPWQEEP